MWDTVYIDIQFSSINIQWYIQLIGVCQSLELKKVQTLVQPSERGLPFHGQRQQRVLLAFRHLYATIDFTAPQSVPEQCHLPGCVLYRWSSMRESRRTTAQSSSFLARLEIHEIHWSYFCHGFAMVLPLKLDELDMLKNQMLLFSCGLLLMMFSSNRCDLKSGSNRQRR